MLRRVLQRTNMTKKIIVRQIGEEVTHKNLDLLRLQDMDREDFQFVAEKLGKNYMEATTDAPKFPVHGMVYGNQFGRKCVLLTVKRRNKCIWVPFVLDGGSPNIILGHDALVALGINPTEVHNSLNVNIHGFDSLAAYYEPEDKRLKDVNLIGWSFFRDTNCFEFLDPETKTLRLYQSFTHFKDELKKH